MDSSTKFIAIPKGYKSFSLRVGVDEDIDTIVRLFYNYLERKVLPYYRNIMEDIKIKDIIIEQESEYIQRIFLVFTFETDEEIS